MTSKSETVEWVWAGDFSKSAAEQMGGDHIARAVATRTIFDEIEIAIKEGALPVYVRGLSGMVERPCRSVEPTFPVGDYRVKLATVEAWLTRAQQAAPAPATLSDGERRLARLRELGGSAKHSRGEWRFEGIGRLAAVEKAEGRKRSDAKTIGRDLKEAAQNEREVQRAGFQTGLGQR